MFVSNRKKGKFVHLIYDGLNIVDRGVVGKFVHRLLSGRDRIAQSHLFDHINGQYKRIKRAWFLLITQAPIVHSNC